MNPLDLKYLFEDIQENNEYEQYLTTHISNVNKGYQWLKENLPEVLDEHHYSEELAYYGDLDDIIAQHDASKYSRIPDRDRYYELTCEYDAYADYFYGPEKTEEVKTMFDLAWLAHIHANPHHWQHWLLQNDDPKIGLRILDMPYVFIIEMLCDWWSFSWKTGNLTEVFDWYNKNKEGILLSEKTRNTLENILDMLKSKLEGADTVESH